MHGLLEMIESRYLYEGMGCRVKSTGCRRAFPDFLIAFRKDFLQICSQEWVRDEMG